MFTPSNSELLSSNKRRETDNIKQDFVTCEKRTHPQAINTLQSDALLMRDACTKYEESK